MICIIKHIHLNKDKIIVDFLMYIFLLTAEATHEVHYYSQ